MNNPVGADPTTYSLLPADSEGFAAQPANTAWHSQSAEDVLSRLESAAVGLSSQEAAQRLSTSGPNELKEGKPISPLRIVLGQFKSLLIWILIAAGVISGLLGEAGLAHLPIHKRQSHARGCPFLHPSGVEPTQRDAGALSEDVTHAIHRLPVAARRGSHPVARSGDGQTWAPRPARRMKPSQMKKEN